MPAHFFFTILAPKILKSNTMKKFCLFIFLVLASVYSFAQNASITFESEKSERFWIYVNGKQQNHHPESFIQIDGLYADWDYNIRIVMENKRRSEMSTVMRLHHGNNSYSLNCNSRSGQISLNQKHGNYPPHPQNGNYNQQYPPQGNPPKFPPQGNHQYPPQGNPPQFPPQGNHQYPPQGNPPQFPPQGNPPTPPQYGNHNHNKPPVPQLAEPIPAPMPCSDADFADAKRTIEKADFEDTKLTIAKQIVASELMTAKQLAEIANLFDFEHTKLEFLKFAYPYCFDQNKYYMVNDVFDFSSSVDELNKFINK